MELKEIKIKLDKLPKDKLIDNIIDQPNPIEEFIRGAVKNYESLILGALEKFGITPDGYPENLKRVTMYHPNKWDRTAHVYIDNNYVFSVIREPKLIDPKRYGVKLYWKIQILDELIGTSEWRPEC